MPRASRTCTLLVTALCAGVMLDAPPAGATSAAPGEFDAFRTAAVFLEGGTLTTSPPERLGTLLPSGKVRYSTRKFGVFTLRVALDRIVVANKGETKLLSLNGVQKKPRELVK